MTPGDVDANGSPVASSIGSASMSPRTATIGARAVAAGEPRDDARAGDARERSTAPSAVTTSASRAAVRCSFHDSSGAR